MKSKRYLYGLMGLLSLLGFIGVFTEAKSFLAFFAFVVDFEYFFIKSDEMLEEYMNKSASRAFYCGMISVALVAFVCFFAGIKEEKLSLIHISQKLRRPMPAGLNTSSAMRAFRG